MPRTHFRTCNLCEAMCGIEVTLTDERITAIKGDAADPMSRGYHCIKAEALADLHEDPRRLRRPVRRTKTGWEELSWDAAFAEVAAGLAGVQRRHGPDAVASYVGNPNVHNYGSLLFLSDLRRVLGSRSRYSATSVDQLPHHVVAYFLFGHQLLLPVPDLDRTQFLLILGGNPAVSRGSMMTAPDIANRLRDLRERGGRSVLIDPRRTETAALVSEHHYIRPGTDAGLLLAMLHVLFKEGRPALGRLAEFTDGLAPVAALVEAFPPERMAAVTGVPADVATELARSFAAAPRAVCYGRVGASTQEFGALTQWLIAVLNTVTGNLDRPGGAMFTTPAVDVLPRVSRGRFRAGASRVRGLPEFAGELPAAALAEEILTPGTGQVRGLITVAGNPVLSTPQGNRLEQGLAGLEFMAAVDPYVNETTRFANIILPPTGPLEHENYDLIFHILAIRNTAKYSPALFPAPEGSRHDWEILAELTARVAAARRASLGRRLALALGRHLAPPARRLSLGLRFGPHGSGLNPFGRGLTLAKVQAAPHGIDLGPLEPRLPGRLFTANKRIDLASAVFVADVERARAKWFPALAPAPEAAGLVLIGRRLVRTNNSWMGHIPRLTTGKSPCTALLSVEDAARHGVRSGDTIRVTSRVGSLTIKANVVSTIMPGVISIPHGFGHDRPDVGMTFGAGAAGASVNDITDASVVDALCGNAVLNGVPVRIEVVR